MRKTGKLHEQYAPKSVLFRLLIKLKNFNIFARYFSPLSCKVCGNKQRIQMVFAQRMSSCITSLLQGINSKRNSSLTFTFLWQIINSTCIRDIFVFSVMSLAFTWKIWVRESVEWNVTYQQKLKRTHAKLWIYDNEFSIFNCVF